MSENIFAEIAKMRRGMKAIGCTQEEIDVATKDVQAQQSYEDALETIKKYWK